ncbi:MAG: aminotransferase class I/II-fold pyridoxal phosphate-dependent enzyme [Woeseiaceae bacterium]|nr:aminotransferase class I/II-fold pyridoxal phosphate-dependent enzyme [Woeseiaceae bacterium]
MERVPVFQPHIAEDTIEHLVDALDVGWLGMGATTQEFEERISAYLGLEGRYVCATNTGTAALHIALRAAGVGHGDEVITPSFNYVADHQAIRMTGADVVMCDIRNDNLGIDVEKAADLVSERTRAIIPLHFAGLPCDIAGVRQLAAEHGLRVIEDAMHAFGTTLDNRKIGSDGDICCFSFDPVKIITSIDGGCVVVNSEAELDQLQRLRLLGVDRDTTERYKNRRAWEYDVVSEGYRNHLTNIMASIGVSQIKRVDEFIASRQAVCKAYNAAFSAVDGLKVPHTDFDNVSPFIYSLRVPQESREGLIAHLQERKVDTGIHFIAVHKHSFFADARRGDMSVTDRVTAEVLTLPLHSNMREDFVERVIDGVSSYFM